MYATRRSTRSALALLLSQSLNASGNAKNASSAITAELEASLITRSTSNLAQTYFLTLLHHQQIWSSPKTFHSATNAASTNTKSHSAKYASSHSQRSRMVFKRIREEKDINRMSPKCLQQVIGCSNARHVVTTVMQNAQDYFRLHAMETISKRILKISSALNVY